MNEIIITNTNGQLTVSSLQVAESFEKRHDHIIRDIEELLPKIGEMSADENLTAENSVVKKYSTQNCVNLFIESSYADRYGRCQKCYEMTRDGFSLLVMGFTGKKALEWKLKYIEAFNLMEEKLKEIQKQTAIPDGFNAETLEIEEMNARTRMSSQLLKLAKTKDIPKPYRDKLLERSVEVLTGEKLTINELEKPSQVETDVLNVLSEQSQSEEGYTVEMRYMTVTEFITHNISLRKYDTRTVGKILEKYGYNQKRARVKGIPKTVRQLPYKIKIH